MKPAYLSKLERVFSNGAIHMLLQILLGFLYANILEWTAHKYLLHDLGKKRGSMFSYHWSYHHRVSRKFEMKDPSYAEGPFSQHRYQEVCGILFLIALHLIPILIFPYFMGTACIYAAIYLYLHKKCHMDAAWCKKYMPWHYRHHCGRDQDTNFNVVIPIADYLFRTSRRY